MHNWRSKAWWALGIAAAVLLLGAISVHAFFDKARVIEMVQSRVKTAIARDLKIGDLDLQLMPFPALVAKQVTLSNPSWARNKNLVEADSVTAHLKLLPLFGGQIALSTVTINGLRANPELAANGRKSWDFETGVAARSGETRLPQVSTLQIRNAEVSYVNGNTVSKLWKIDQLSAHANSGWRTIQFEARITRNGFPMELSGELADLSKAGVKGAVSGGAIRARWGDAQLALDGQFPLEAALEGTALKVNFQSQSLQGLLGFLAISNGAVAPIKGSAEIGLQQGWISFGQLQVRMGGLTVTGDARVKPFLARPQFDARLSADRLDWPKTLSDAGRPPRPPRPPGELFHTNPFAWPLLVAMERYDGALDARINSFVLHSGVEIKDARARMSFKGDRVQVSQFSGKLLSGSASGSAQLEGRRKSIRVNLEANDISLGEWLAERENKLALTGGPMKISAAVTASGASMKDLAASLTGPVSVQVGAARIQSQKIQEAESLLIGLAPMLSAKDANQVNLACIGARMQFVSGRAEGEPIVGARSDVSQILTGGYIDLREQTLDLSGRIRARSGVSLGISSLAGAVKISGKLLQPQAGLDPSGTPGILARIGAAIATGGASLLVTSIWDAANPASDPCRIVLTAAPQVRSKAQSSASAAQ